MVVLICCCAVFFLAAAYLWMILCAQPSREQAEPFFHLNCAHRGLFEKDQSVPENTIRAFERAVEHGYGVELDVQLTKDGEVVVFHDDSVDRETEYKGRVDSFSLAQLQSMSLFGTSGETLGIPLFTDVMRVLDEKSPVIVELKTTENYRELCEKNACDFKDFSGALLRRELRSAHREMVSEKSARSDARPADRKLSWLAAYLRAAQSVCDVAPVDELLDTAALYCVRIHGTAACAPAGLRVRRDDGLLDRKARKRPRNAGKAV